MVYQAQQAPRAKAMQAAMGSVVRRAVPTIKKGRAVVVVQVRQAEMGVVFPRTALTLETGETELSGPPVAGTTTAAAAGVQSPNTTQQRVAPAAWVVGEMVVSALRPEPMV
jgi:hypothetical protein